MVPTFIESAAVACLFTPLVAVIVSGIPAKKIPSANGLSNFVRITAGAFGTSITTTLWDNRATLHHVNLTEYLAGGGQNTAEGLGALAKMRISAQQAAAQLNRIIDQQSFTWAADDIFLGSAVMFTLLIGVVWLSKPSMSSAPVNDGGAH